MDIGSLRHRVRLENPTLTSDGDGGYITSWTRLTLGDVYAAIEPATQRNLERLVANAVASDASHVVTIRYHSEVTTKTRVVFAGRALMVVGLQDPDERHVMLRLACVESLDAVTTGAPKDSWVQENWIQ